MSDTGRFARDVALRDRIRPASVATMSNIAEGFERDGNAELIQSPCIAKASAAEVRSQLYVGLNAGYIDERTFRLLATQARDVGGTIAGLINHLRRSPMKGLKFLPHEPLITDGLQPPGRPRETRSR